MVFITGRYLLSPLSAPGRSTFQAILAGHSLADRGIVPEELLEEFSVSHFQSADGAEGPVDKSIRMAAFAARRAVEAAGWTNEKIQDDETSLFVGTSKGPILAWLAALDLLRDHREMPPGVAGQIACGPGAMGVQVAAQLRIRGTVHTSVAACSSGMHALHRAARAIQYGECERAIVVAADASIHELFEGSFARLGVLSPADSDGHRRCRPFDAGGAGFFLTEAAAALALEKTRSGIDVLTLESTWIGGDGTHLLAIDPATRALRTGLRTACAGPLSFIHAHATGTGHDALELAALRSAARDVPVFSHKRWLGHSLGAAGLASVVLSADCHAADITLDHRALKNPARSLTLSQGFGGHIAMAVIGGEAKVTS